MPNPHPPLSAFPIVILILLAANELVIAMLPSTKNTRRAELSKISNWLLITLCLLAPLTYYSGYFGAEVASHTFTISEDTIGRHRLLAKCLMLSLVPLAICGFVRSDANQSKVLSWVWYLALSISVCLAVMTGKLGGSLVFDLGAGVTAPPPYRGPAPASGTANPVNP